MHFVSVGKRLAEGLSNTNIDTISHIATPSEKFTFSKISTEQVKQVVRKLVNNKATGVHDIPNRVLKDSVDVIAPFLTEIFNCSLLSKMFPDDLKTGKVAPVFKSGDRDNLNNYRPITVLPTIDRVFKKTDISTTLSVPRQTEDYKKAAIWFSITSLNCFGSELGH